ncbi:MAG: hypothetical protein LDL33_00085, partial [Desulfomonile sp.]|nr:hypothetical protein [Desulfomonile sp.]
LPECFDNQGKMRATPPSDACRWRSYVGKELWAYMPSNILSQLKDIGAQSYGTTGGTCMHRFTIDLSPQVYPVYRTGLGWRMVLVGGQRGGGDIYFAIDVTDPDNPELLWEYSVLKNLKEYNGTTITTIPDYTAYYEKLKALPTTWSVPYVGRIRVPHGIAFGGTECTDSGGCKKHVMFAGGGFRVFDESVTVDGHTIDLKPLRNPHIIGIDVNTGENLLADLWPTFRKEGYQTDKFPEIKRVYDKTRKAEYYIPYAGGDILLLDEYNPAATSTSYAGSDGFVDRIYLGDLTGYFYGYKFNFDTEDTQKGVLIDVWSTRSISGCVRNAYRWDRQPITTRPQASDDPTYRDRYLRVVVAAGKYDDVPGNDDDKIDSARTSLYSLIDEKAQTDYSLINGGPRIGGGSGYKAALRFRCGDHTAAYGKYRPCYSRDISQCKLDCSACADADLPTCCGGSKANCELLCGNASTTGCEPPAKCCSYNCTGVDAVCSGCATWVVESTSLPDCGESSCCDKRDTSTCTTPPCWACVYDLALPYDSTVGDKANYPGERLVSKPLIASETLFVTSYVPAYDPCTAMGTGYLYIFDYACRPFPKDWSPLNDTAFVPDEMRTSDNTLYGLRLSLGSGPPSDPVLDSAGHYVYVQMGTAEIVRIGVDLTRPGPSSGEGGGGGGGGGGTSVSPSPNWFRIRGWKEGQ